MRKIKWLTLLLVMSMCIFFSGCQKTEDTEDADYTEEISSTQSDEGDLLLGRWVEINAHRGVMDITENEGTILMRVSWPDSAFEEYKWDLYGALDAESMSVSYQGSETKETYDENGLSKIELVDDACAGTMAINHGNLYWLPEGAEEAYVFVREDAAEGR